MAYQVDNASAATSFPTPAAVGPNPNGFFTNGSPGVTPATVVDQDWLNMVQEEICNVVTAANITLSKTTQNQLLKAIQTLGRIRLTATLNLYVATTGNDGNAGTSAGAPFQTLQGAANAAANLYDTNGFSINVNVADGTYTAGVNIARALVGGGPLNFTGDVATPANCVINAINASCFTIDDGSSTVSGFKLTATGSALGQGCALLVGGAATVGFTAISFGACSQYHVYAGSGGNLVGNNATWTISGGAAAHFVASQGFVNVFGCTILIPAAVAFTNFAVATLIGAIQCVNATTFTGAGVAGTTGTRYAISVNAAIATNGAGASYFPGSAAGVASSGGSYE